MNDPQAPDAARRFEQMAWPLLPVMLRLARYFHHDEHRAEDLVQETLLRALRSIDQYRPGTSFQAWLLTILRRLFIDQYRARRRHGKEVSIQEAGVEEPADPHAAPAGRFDEHWTEPEELMQRFEDAHLIDALRKLPEEIRWTLLLVDVEQIDQAEAAVILEVPVGTIKSRAHRGRQMLRDQLLPIARQQGWIPAEKGLVP